MLLKTTALALGASLFASAAMAATLYKDPRCGCCALYADYMRENGYAVAIEDTLDTPMMSVEAGIPADKQGCHLLMIEGYAVSGHVPVEAVAQLLSERPDIDGLTLPGMPMGSPGMGGAKQAPFEILALAQDGQIATIFMEL